jgi:mevalonate kinase
MKETFYSNGKLLITGEYLVLDGATAFALPTKFGQNLIVEKTLIIKFTGKALTLTAKFGLKKHFVFRNQNELPQETETVKATLISILHQGYLLNRNFITGSMGYNITTHLNFLKMGTGNSSTLINNIAQWLQIDAFTLLNNSFGGSGYDIACAQNNCPILYHLKKANLLKSFFQSRIQRKHLFCLS